MAVVKMAVVKIVVVGGQCAGVHGAVVKIVVVGVVNVQWSRWQSMCSGQDGATSSRPAHDLCVRSTSTCNEGDDDEMTWVMSMPTTAAVIMNTVSTTKAMSTTRCENANDVDDDIDGDDRYCDDDGDEDGGDVDGDDDDDDVDDDGAEDCAAR